MIHSMIRNKISRRWHQPSGSISQCIQSEIRMSRIEPERFYVARYAEVAPPYMVVVPLALSPCIPKGHRGELCSLTRTLLLIMYSNIIFLIDMKIKGKKRISHKTLEPKDKRSEVVHFKVNPREYLDIYTTAQKCGMTVSEYVRSRAVGYEPIARLTTEEKDLITKLAQVRADNSNLLNAISGLTSEEKCKLFHNRELMYKWYSTVRPITDAVSEFIRKVTNMKMLRTRTANETEKEVTV